MIPQYIAYSLAPLYLSKDLIIASKSAIVIADDPKSIDWPLFSIKSNKPSVPLIPPFVNEEEATAAAKLVFPSTCLPKIIINSW